MKALYPSSKKKSDKTKEKTVKSAEPSSRREESKEKKDESYDGDQSNSNFLTLDYLEKRGKSENNDDDSVSEEFSEDEFEPAQPDIKKTQDKRENEIETDQV